MAQKIQVEVFWVVMPCSVVAGHNVSEDIAGSIFRVKVYVFLTDKRTVYFQR
jgi:hypothetical protein